LAVERFELPNQCRKPLQVPAVVRCELALIVGGDRFQLLQTHQPRKNPAFTEDVRRCDMMGNAINPSPQRTTGIVPMEAPPQLKMNVLTQVSTLFRVSLVGSRKPFQ
jgi:hypothetical protein